MIVEETLKHDTSLDTHVLGNEEKMELRHEESSVPHLARFANKTQVVSTIAIAIVMWINMGLATDSPDYDVYLSRFNIMVNAAGFDDDINPSQMERGFVLAMWLGSRATTSFSVFLAVFSALCIVFFVIVIRLFTSKPFIPLVYCFITSFPSYATQIRHFSGLPFCLLGIAWLLASKRKRNYVIYILFIVVASQFHQVFWFFLILLLIRLPKRILYILCICAALITPILYNWVVLNGFFVRLDRYEVESFDQVSTARSALLVLLAVVNLGAIYVRQRKIAPGPSSSLYTHIFTINLIVASLAVPMMFSNSNYIRLMWVANLLTFTFFQVPVMEKHPGQVSLNLGGFIVFIVALLPTIYGVLTRGDSWLLIGMLKSSVVGQWMIQGV